MIYTIKPPVGPVFGDVILPASKSISNRALLIRALSGSDAPIHNLSDCDDTDVMLAAISQMPDVIDIGAAGTSMRFLTAYLALREGEVHVITGSERMKQRPIGILVDALRKLGADIEYLENEGFPPLRIKGRRLKGRLLELPGNVSSQYISALLMIAPLLEGGLTLRMKGNIGSRPYIQMTLSMMRHFGIEADWKTSGVIQVHPGRYAFSEYTVEPDWSASSYWFEVIAIAGREYLDMLGLPGITTDSLQGDREVAHIFEKLGVTSFHLMESFRMSYVRTEPVSCLYYDFADVPDLAQAVVVACCLSDIPFVFSGLESLHIKETDRIEALKTELAKLGYLLKGGDDGTLMWQRGKCRRIRNAVIETYHDHRMAMAFAPCCMKFGQIRIADPGVVSKSYPGYWEDLRRLGFTITEENG